jgi:hypothetical protein
LNAGHQPERRSLNSGTERGHCNTKNTDMARVAFVLRSAQNPVYPMEKGLRRFYSAVILLEQLRQLTL